MKYLKKKNIVAMAIAGALAAPLAAQAGDDAEVSGFIDVIGNADAGAVFVADAEIDVVKKVGAVTVRVDVDVRLAGNGASTTSSLDTNDDGFVNAADTSTNSSLANLEQAYFAWAATETVTVLGGLFNNPIGQELEDAPNMDFTSHSVVYNILNNQTALYGNNVAGVAVAGALGPATVTLAVIDDIGFSADTKGKGHTSVAAVVNLSPMKGLDLELGYVTQNDTNGAGAGTAGNVINVNGKFNTGPLTVGLDYLTSENVVDSAVNLWVGFDVDDKTNVKVRYESLAFEGGGDDSTRTTLYATHAIEENLSVALEWSQGDTAMAADGVMGIIDDDTTTLEFIGTF